MLVLLLQKMLYMDVFLMIFPCLLFLNHHQYHMHCLLGLVISMGCKHYEYVINEAFSLIKEFKNPLLVIPSIIIARIYNRFCQYYETMKLFSMLEKHNVITWNIAISACVWSKSYNRVFELLKQMYFALSIQINTH